MISLFLDLDSCPAGRCMRNTQLVVIPNTEQTANIDMGKVRKSAQTTDELLWDTRIHDNLGFWEGAGASYHIHVLDTGVGSLRRQANVIIRCRQPAAFYIMHSMRN